MPLEAELFTFEGGRSFLHDLRDVCCRNITVIHHSRDRIANGDAGNAPKISNRDGLVLQPVAIVQCNACALMSSDSRLGLGGPASDHRGAFSAEPDPGIEAALTQT